MKYLILSLFLVLNVLAGNLDAQMNEPMMPGDTTTVAHSILPVDGIIEYMPHDSMYTPDYIGSSSGKIRFTPLVNFFFRPEGTFDYKEAGLPIDTGNLNFYLRGDFGGKISLPKNIDMVFNLSRMASIHAAQGHWILISLYTRRMST